MHEIMLNDFIHVGVAMTDYLSSIFQIARKVQNESEILANMQIYTKCPEKHFFSYTSHPSYIYLTKYLTQDRTATVTWLKSCRYGVKLNQSGSHTLRFDGLYFQFALLDIFSLMSHIQQFILGTIVINCT